jgi:hypothetical protein
VIHNGTNGLVVEAMKSAAFASAVAKPAPGWEARGTPVWPAEILNRAMYGSEDGEVVDQVVGVAYAFSDLLDASDAGTDLAREARRLRDQLVGGPAGGSDRAAADAVIDGWMRAIEGHRLWTDMTAQPSYALTCGWLLENYHYISAIAQHTGAAIASCSDARVRSLLVHHLEEELEHRVILGKALSQSRYGDVCPYRPLVTTTAFVGALCELARRDWRAYVLALAFLQRTLVTGDGGSVHGEFYTRVRAGTPDAAALLEAMRRHDDIDTDLGHGDDVAEVLDALYAASGVSGEHVDAAALIPHLCWSFLDGIRDHYRHGDMAVMGRVGWTAG